MPTEKHDDRLLLGRDEAEHEDVSTPTVVTLQNGLSQGGVPMEGHLLVS